MFKDLIVHDQKSYNNGNINKIQELDVYDMFMKNKIDGLDLINCLVFLGIILKKIDKISTTKGIEAEKIDELELLQ